MTFGDKLRAKKKGLKANSIDTYLRNIRRLRRVHGKLPIPDSHKWLVEKKLFTWFDDQPLNIRRHMATAAQVALQAYNKSSKEWQRRQSESMKEFDEDRRRRKMSEKQKSQMPKKGFDALKSVIVSMKHELRHILTISHNDWTFSDLLRIQELIIISLYYDRPLRLDFATLEISGKENSIYKSLKKPRGWHVRLTDFKTVKSLGPKVFKLNLANQRLLNKFIPAVKRLTTHGYLLTNQSKNRMTRQVLSKKLMSITKKRIGKKFSTQLLRILFAMKHRGIIESAKEVSDKLLHSQEQSLQYAKKD